MSTEVEDIGGVVGEHVVQFYGCDAELATSVSRYLLDGLRRGEVGVLIATEAHRRAVEGELVAAGVDLTEARRGGTFVSLDAARTMSRFVVDGNVDRGGFRAVIGGVLAQAAGTGRQRRDIRAYGEMVALLWEAGQVLAAIELEGLWNEISRDVSFSLLCAYPSEAVSGAGHADAFREVCRLHSAVLHAGVTTSQLTGQFAARLDAARSARRFVVNAVRSWSCDEDLASDAALIVTELATNAIIHTQLPFTVALSWDTDRVRISVEDASPLVPVPRDAGTMAQSGRGLAMVAAVASSWGMDRVDDRKTMWAELSRPLP